MRDGMKTPEQLLQEVSQMIASIHHRPTMYVGSKSSAGDANTLDAVMWMAHWFWATIQSREREFRDARDRIKENHDCSCQSFPDAFRRQNPDADELATFEHVLNCWAEVDHLLKIDVSETAARVPS